MLKESPETSAEISNIVDELQGNNEQRENGQILSHSYLFDEFKCEVVATKGHKSSMIFGPTSVYSKCSAKSSGIIKDTAKLPISRVRIKVMLEITVSFYFLIDFQDHSSIIIYMIQYVLSLRGNIPHIIFLFTGSPFYFISYKRILATTSSQKS